MPVVTRERVMNAPAGTLWDVIADPHHLTRWWPGIERMEGIEDRRFTQVLMTKRGRRVRADYRIVRSESERHVTWEQELAGTPFAGVLSKNIIDIALEPSADGTRVTLTQRQDLRGYSRTGGFMLRRATAAKLQEALEGLERIT